SGCGKSTLLRLLLGLIETDCGDVYIGGERMQRSNLRQLRHAIGYVVQQGGLFPHLSAADNVTLLSRYLRWDAARVAERMECLRALTHLPRALLQRFPAELSGGQRQRVSLMRALMLDPPIVLLDEPLGALDPVTRAHLQQDLREIFRSLDKTVLLVTHDMSEAAYFADTLVLMRQGQIVQQGSLKTLLNAPSEDFVEHFIRAQRSLADAWEER
ncbi:MAG: ATP-binding cassette domain-containing protein, partial [Polyangiales bacterium]